MTVIATEQRPVVWQTENSLSLQHIIRTWEPSVISCVKLSFLYLFLFLKFYLNNLYTNAVTDSKWVEKQQPPTNNNGRESQKPI